MDIEKQIISSALTNKSYLYLLLENYDIIQDPRNKIILEALKELVAQNMDIDSIVLNRFLLTSGNDKKVSAEYISEIITTFPGVNPKFLIESLRQQRGKEKLVLASKDLYNTLQRKDISYDKFIEQIISIQNELETDNTDTINMTEFASKDIDSIFNESDFLSYGLKALDAVLAGLFKGQLIVIAGTPGAGKTVLGLQLAELYKSLFVSMEMKKRELFARMISCRAKVSALKVEAKNLSDSEFKRAFIARQEIIDTTKMIVYDKESDFFKLLNKARQHVKHDGVELVVFDYLQLFSGVSGANKNEKIEEITRTLKNFAHENNVPVILLSQFTKDVIKEGREPTIGDLRGSGAIGQDADVVLLLYDFKEKWCLTIGKGRKSKTGNVSLKFEKQFSRIVDSDYFDSMDYIHD